MAPMVSASDYAFRCLVRQYAISMSGSKNNHNHNNNVPLTFTQMLHAANLIRDDTFGRNHIDLYEFESHNHHHPMDGILPPPPQRDLTVSQRNLFTDCTHNGYNSNNHPYYAPPCVQATCGPVIAQLAGHDVTTVVKAAQKIVSMTRGQITGIDLNLGCPQNIARKGNYGAYLMENHPNTACQILKALRQTLPTHILVSAKIRLPYNPTQQVERLQRLCDTGIDFITIHGRDYTENKTTVKHIQLSRLIHAVQTIQEYSHDRIPVIVNGGIELASDAIYLQQVTGAAAIMSSEALLERPDLFGEIHNAMSSSPSSLSQEEQYVSSSASPSQVSTITPAQRFDKQIQLGLDYIRWCYYAPPLSFGLGQQGGSFNVVRGHLFKLLYRYLNDPMNYDLRTTLGDGSQTQRLDQAQALIDTLQERYASYTTMDWELLSSSQYPESTWYRRHRSASSLVHERIQPNAYRDDNDTTTTQTTSLLDTTKTLYISVEERKRRIRERIDTIRQQKKQLLL
jgi:tRNA-dihydrouridine synthase